MSEYTRLEVFSVTAVLTAQGALEDQVVLQLRTTEPPDRTYALTFEQARSVIEKLQQALDQAEAESRRGSSPSS